MTNDPKTTPPKTPSYLKRNGGVPLDHPRRCQADAVHTGEPCRKYAIRGGNVCRTHGGSAPQVVAKANERLALASDRMAENLLNIATEAKSEHVQYLATTAALDRAGVVQPTQVQVDVNAPWAEVFQAASGINTWSRAESRAARGLPVDPVPELPAPPLEVVDAEVVEDTPSSPPNAQTRPAWGQEPPRQPGTGLQTLEDALEDLRKAQRRRPGAR